MIYSLNGGNGNGGRLVADTQVQRGGNDDYARIRRIGVAWKRYEGYYNKPLLPTDIDPNADDNITINYARQTVDISAFYLFGKEVGFEVDGEGESDADIWLNDCWNAQPGGKMPFLLEFATGAGVAGDGFIRVMEPDKAEGEIYPRLVDLDAQNVKVIYDAADYKRVRQYKIQWEGFDDDNKPIVYRHLIIKDGGSWYTSEQESRGAARDFVTIRDAVKWPYPFCPIFHTKNRPMPHCFFGTGDIEDDVLRINDNINFVVSNINRILRAHGHPLTYVTGANLAEIDRAVGKILSLPNPEAKVDALELISDLASSFDQLKALREAYHELTSIPEIVSGKVENVGQLSGLALQILYGPLTQLTQVKRLLYGAMLQSLNLALLVMGKFTAKEVTNQWPTILPVDRKAEAETAITLQEAGVSKDTTLQELQYDSVSEAEKKAQETAAVLETQKQVFDRGNVPPANNPFGGNGAQ